MSPERRQFQSTTILKNNYLGSFHKGKEVEGRELKLHRLTADKKQRKVRWSLLSETGQKSDSMFATNPHSFVLCYFIYFISDIILSVS